MTISQQAQDVRRRVRVGLPGQPLYAGKTNLVRDALNQSPQRVKTATITVDSGVNGAIYSVTINGSTVEYESESTDTSVIAAGLEAAIVADPLATAVVAVESAANVITLTGLYPGFDWSLVGASANLTTSVTQQPLGAAPIPFGSFVVSQGYDEQDELCALASSAMFAEQAETWSVAYVQDAVLGVTVFERRGSELHVLADVEVTSATGQAETVTAIANALNAALPANSVVVSVDDDNLVLAAEIAGLEFEVVISHLAGGATGPAISKVDSIGPDASTSIHRAALGVAMHTRDDNAGPIGTTEGAYEGNAGLRVLVRGDVWVALDGQPSKGGPVYVELAGDDAGKLFTSGSSTRVALARDAASWQNPGPPADGVSAVRLSL